MAMHLVSPHGHKRKWDIPFKNWDGVKVKVPGDRDRAVAACIAHRILLLLKAKVNGDPPPVELRAWIDNMPSALADRLIELGLLDRRRFERGRPLTDHITDFEANVANRKSNTATHAKQ